MFVFGKDFDQLIRATLLKINTIINLSGICLDLDISFNSLSATLFHFSFARKNVFYSENIRYVYKFYGIDMYVDALHLELSRTSTVKLLCENPPKKLYC